MAITFPLMTKIRQHTRIPPFNERTKSLITSIQNGLRLRPPHTEISTLPQKCYFKIEETPQYQKLFQFLVISRSSYKKAIILHDPIFK